MPAPVRELADALLEIIADYPIDPALAPVRAYVPIVDWGKVSGIKCFVVPREDETQQKAARGNLWNHQLIIDVALLSKLSDDTNATADVLLDLADGLCEHLKANRPDRPEKLMLATVQALWDREQLKKQIYSTAVTLTFENIR